MTELQRLAEKMNKVRLEIAQCRVLEAQKCPHLYRIIEMQLDLMDDLLNQIQYLKDDKA